jgi:hypothetical protein
MPDAIETPPSPSGISGMMAEFSDGPEDTATVTPKVETPKVEAKPASVEKPVVKTPEKPAEKVVPKPEVKVDPKKEDNNQLRTRLEQLAKENKTLKEVELAKLQKENKELQQRRYVTPDMEKEIEANKAEITRLKGEVAQSAYERSDEFKVKHVEPWQRTLKSILDQRAVHRQTKDATRQDGLTQGNISRLRPGLQLPGWRAGRGRRKLFSTNALRVLAAVDKLNNLSRKPMLTCPARGVGSNQGDTQRGFSTNKYEAS